MSNPPPQKIKVAVIQMKPKPLDPEANFVHATSEIRKAAEQGADLAVLPEYHLTAWEPNDPKFQSIAREAHKYQDSYQALAKELQINICTGTIVQTPREERELRNTNEPTLLNVSAFISSTGDVLGTYLKTNIWIPERQHLTSSVAYAQSQPNNASSKQSKNLQHAGIAHSEPSESPNHPHAVIETPLGQIGILICWDLAFPEAFRSLLNQDVRLILIPTYWTAFDMCDEGLKINPNAEKLFLEATLTARAFENTCTIVFCNPGGPREEGYLGLSGVYAPILGRVPPSFEDGEEGVRVIEIDFGVQVVAEGNYKVREDMKGEDWHYGYQKTNASV